MVIDEIEAGAEFLQRLNRYMPVKAACWLRRAENEERYLYAALDGLTDENSGVAYSEVLRIAGEIKDRYIDPFRVKLINAEHPVAKAVMELYRRYPGKTPTRFNDRLFAYPAVAEVYVYPQFTDKP